MNRAITACFTGHREISEAATSVDARITDVIGELIGQGYQFFCAGGARGFDMLAAQSVLRQKERHPHVMNPPQWSISAANRVSRHQKA